MLRSTLLLSCAAGLAFAGPGYLKLGLEREHGPRLTKRQTDSSQLEQEIVPGENGSVCAAPAAA